MTNWTEVNVYTGRPVDEDAPTNFAGTGSGVDMNPTGMRKKKKLIDARSKSYKTHRAKLETARVKREAKRNSVKEGTLNEKSAKYLELEFKDKQTAINAYRHINNKIAAGGSQPWKDFNQEGNSLQFDKMDDADGLMKELKKKFKFKVYEREEVELDETILKEIKKASLKFSLGMNSDMMKAKKDLEKKGHKVKVSGNKMTVTAKSGSDIDRELSDIRNFYDRGVEITAENFEESVELEEETYQLTERDLLKLTNKTGFSKADFKANENDNDHSLNAIMLARAFGSSQEFKDMINIDKRHKERGSINEPDYQKRNALVKKYYSRLK